MKVASVDSSRFEPTVFAAVRRYWTMVVAFAVAAMVASVGYTLIAGKTYRAEATITVPMPPSLQGQDPAQYLDSQVLLLQSQGVAQQAAKIADASLHTKSLSARDFSTSGGSVSITPPAGPPPASTGPALPPRASLHRAPGWRRLAPTPCSRPSLTYDRPASRTSPAPPSRALITQLTPRPAQLSERPS